MINFAALKSFIKIKFLAYICQKLTKYYQNLNIQTTIIIYCLPLLKCQNICLKELMLETIVV
jgi:hypothetical protein